MGDCRVSFADVRISGCGAGRYRICHRVFVYKRNRICTAFQPESAPVCELLMILTDRQYFIWLLKEVKKTLK